MLQYETTLVYATKIFEIQGKDCSTIFDSLTASDLGLDDGPIDLAKATEVIYVLQENEDVALD